MGKGLRLAGKERSAIKDGLVEAQTLLEKCNGKLSFLATASWAMMIEEPEVDCRHWEGLQCFCQDIMDELMKAHGLINQAC